MLLKTIIWWLILLFGISFTLFGALAEVPPFDQCIKVADINNGSFRTDLTCNLYNGTNLIPMGVKNNFYCMNVNNTYSVGTSIDFIATCTDGKFNRSVVGNFAISEVSNSGGFRDYSPKKETIIEIKTLCGEGLILVNDSCVTEKKEINYLLWFLTSAIILTLAFSLIWYYFWWKGEEN